MKIHIYLGNDTEKLLRAVKQNTNDPGIKYFWPELDCGLYQQFPLTAIKSAEVTDLIISRFLDEKQDIIIVTHSEHVLNRIRLRVAEGKILPEAVVIHWVSDENPAEIGITNSGSLKHWPKDMFDHISNELCAIIRARKKNK